MERVKLGKTGIEVSKMGIGTGTAHHSGCFAQSLMDIKDLARLLIYAFDRGINFWDTAFQYRTYLHIREALKQVIRSEIVLSTKFTTAEKSETIRDFDSSLKELCIDYFDICLIHGVRKESEFNRRSGAFRALLELKRAGKIRAIGLSSHGLGALRTALKIPEIDVVWARVNYAGIYMDTHRLPLYDELATIPWLKRVVKHLPVRFLDMIRPKPEIQRLTQHDLQKVEDTLQKIHAQAKGIVGMKVLLEGHLVKDVRKALEYVRNLSFVDAFVVGMMNMKEVEENCKIINGGA
ncbi:MAG: aldo/keto reductase [Nitrospirae bacterium]|nr:aldo/keto reductase [Nitrospirota bacterium]